MEASGPPYAPSPSGTIASIYKSCQLNSEKIFCIETTTGKAFTYKELYNGCIKIARLVKFLGIGKEDVVMVAADPCFESFCIFLGVWFSGAATNPINFYSTKEEIAVMINVTRPRLIFCRSGLDVVEEGRKIAKSYVPTIYINGKESESFNHLVREDIGFELPEINPENHVISVLFTSGTTGFPKGIKVTDVSLKIVHENRLVLGSPFLFLQPFMWISNAFILSSVTIDGRCLLVPRFPVTLDSIVQTVEEYRPEGWFGGPTTLLQLVHFPNIESRDFSSIKYTLSGGSQLMRSQRVKINKVLFKDSHAVRVAYGSTECGMVTMWTDDINVDSEEYEASGQLARGCFLKVVDEATGKSLGPNKVGELCFKSPTKLAGLLLNDGTEGVATDEDGWIRPGDLGSYDEKNLVYIVARRKDIMKYRNIQIAPAEIENVLYKHPEVIECCVVGKLDLLNGELPTAYVVIRPDSVLTPEELEAFVANQVPDAKRLRGGVYFLSALPKSAVGKILRNKVEELL